MLKVHFTDFWDGFDPENNFFMQVLRRSHSVTLDAQKPHFLFYSFFGTEHTQYDCVRICYSGENCTPDFNWCDYAIGFDHMEFGDRYLRFPLFYFGLTEDMGKGLTPQEATEVYARSKFCTFLYSNTSHVHPIREQLFSALSAYRQVDAGGASCNNLGFRVQDHRAWQQQYRFTIACENSEKKGYTTEKLHDALRANTIPIYWGNPSIAEDINPQRIIHVRDYPDLNALVAKIRQLDTDAEEFCRTVAQPWFLGSHRITPEADTSFACFLNNIVSQSPEQARRIPQHGYTKQYQEQARHRINGWTRYQILTTPFRCIRKLPSFFRGIF